jgi:hypothetical protein
VKQLAPIGLALACLINARTLVDRTGNAPISGMFAYGFEHIRETFMYEYERFAGAAPFLPARGLVGYVGPDGFDNYGYARIHPVAQYALAPLHVLPILPAYARSHNFAEALKLHYDAFLVDLRSDEAVKWLAAHPRYLVTATAEPTLVVVTPP